METKLLRIINRMSYPPNCCRPLPTSNPDFKDMLLQTSIRMAAELTRPYSIRLTITRWASY